MNWKKLVQDLSPFTALQETNNSYHLGEIWYACPQGDRMAWLLGRLVSESSREHRRLVRVICRMIRKAMQGPDITDNYTGIVLALTESWTKHDQDITFDVLRSAANRAFNIVQDDQSIHHSLMACGYAACVVTNNDDYRASAAANAIVHTVMINPNDSPFLSRALKVCADMIRQEFGADEVCTMMGSRFPEFKM